VNTCPQPRLQAQLSKRIFEQSGRFRSVVTAKLRQVDDDQQKQYEYADQQTQAFTDGRAT
jgi:hypothetical protein